MTDVYRPPTLTLRSRTGAAKPTLWPTLNPCHFTVPCFISKTKTVLFSSKQALSNNVFGVKIGRTTTLRRLFKVINFRRSKFVCTLSSCPVFGMCAAGLATHLTTPVCPVARTRTIILQVVYYLERTPLKSLQTITQVSRQLWPGNGRVFDEYIYIYTDSSRAPELAWRASCGVFSVYEGAVPLLTTPCWCAS